MTEKILSIVVPIYNSEKFIEQLLQNFLEQDLEKVEIILVDDGSKDNSLKICKEYEKKNDSIVVVHQENQGASAARNKGIEFAKGKYISFVDSDDSISSDYIKNVCDTCEKNPADLIQFDAYIKKAEDITKREFEMEEGYAELNTYYNMVLAQKVNEPWDKAYKASIIHENHISFDTKMTIGEDVSLTLSFLKYAKIVYVHHAAYYYYERNDEGICANAKLKHLADLDLLYRNMKEFEAQMNLNEDSRSAIDSAMLKGVFRTVAWIMQTGEKKRNVIEKMDTLKNINELFLVKYTEKSVELRKQVLKKKMYRVATVIVGMKNKG